mgnify:FL=1
MRVNPKKHLGQHFLLDNHVCEKIANSLFLGDSQFNLMEIGPGTGALTKLLLKEKINLVAYEVDVESVEYLNSVYPQLILRNEDVLKLDWATVFNQDSLSVIGNFPYNISSQILFKVYDHRDLVDQMVGMFQKEVAERICAGPGTKKYGILSVLLQAFYSVEYLFTVNEDVFDPPPKVKSGVIRLLRNDVKKLDCDEKLFFNVVKAIFNQRRKMARNSLKSLLAGKVLEHPLMMKRPEQMQVKDFVTLTKMIESEIN